MIETAGASIQWKGSDCCVDWYCPCGNTGHLDGQYLDHQDVKCECGKVYRLGCEVEFIEVTEAAP